MRTEAVLSFSILRECLMNHSFRLQRLVYGAKACRPMESGHFGTIDASVEFRKDISQMPNICRILARSGETNNVWHSWFH